MTPQEGRAAGRLADTMAAVGAQQDVRWEDSRRCAYARFLAWGWPPVDAAFAAYYGKSFSAELVTPSSGIALRQLPALCVPPAGPESGRPSELEL
jgi:hypothetical protein